MRKQFLTFLVDDQGLNYYLQDGIVTKTNTPKPLQDTPDGWQELAVKYGRNNDKNMFRSFSIPLKFIGDGARILASLFYGGARIQAPVNYVIGSMDDQGIHQPFYSGSPDFTTFDDSQYGVNINMLERGLPELVKANENTTYEIPLDVPEAITINWTGVELLSDVRHANPQSLGYDPVVAGGYYFIEHGGPYINIGMTLSNSETLYPSIIFNDSTQYRDMGANNPWDAAPTDWLMIAQEDTTFEIKSGILRMSVISTGIEIFFSIKNDFTGISRNINIATSPGAGDKTINIAGSYDFQAGDRIYLMARLTGFGVQYSFWGWTYPVIPDAYNSIISQYNFRKAPTDVKALRAPYVFDQLIKKITGGAYGTFSGLLIELQDFVLTCGDAIRGLPGSVLKTSLNDFIKSYNAFSAGEFGISMTVPQLAIFESEEFFWQDSYLVDLGEVANCKFQNATDFQYNAFKFGWPKQSYNDVNGREEFNSTFEWTTPITALSNTGDFISVYRADSYGAEILRNNLSGKTTTDSDSDNDIFIINVESAATGGKYNINRPSTIAVTGVLSPSTVFNILLTPGRCLRAHAAKIRTAMQGSETRYLNMSSTDKNPNVSTQFGGTVIDEDAPIQISQLPNIQYIQSMFMTFDTEVPINLKVLVETNPYAKIRFTFEGDTYVGYIKECSESPALNPAQNFKLIAAKETDLTQRIKRFNYGF